METTAILPIGRVHSTRKAPQDDHWDREQVFIELDSTQFNSESLAGLDDFSHAEILF